MGIGREELTNVLRSAAQNDTTLNELKTHAFTSVF